MSEFDSGNEVTLSSESGVTIEKSFDSEGFAVPAIRFELRSEHDDAVTVRITDRIPDEFPMDNVGFHPEYENDNWTAYEDHRVQFERTLEPSESLTTVYGIRLSDRSDAEDFLTEPKLEEVTPVTEDEENDDEERMEEHTITDIVSEDSSQVVRDVIAGDSGLPGLNDESDEDTVEDGDTDPLADIGTDPLAETDESNPLAEETVDSPEAVDDDDPPFADSTDDIDEPMAAMNDVDDSEDDIIEAPTDSPDGPVSPPRPGSVAAALADEIRAGAVDSDDLTLIQRELDLDTPESTNVRIRHVQSRVDDLAAYTEALEEFIDDNGTAKTLIESFESEVESVRTDLEGMGDEIENTKDEGAQARARVADLEAGLDELETGVESDLADLEADVDELGELGSTLDVLESQIEALEDLVATNTEEASVLDGEIEDLRDDFEAVESLEDEIETLSHDVTDLSDSVSAAETRTDEKVEAIRSDVADIEDELKALHEWRDQLGSVFGGN